MPYLNMTPHYERTSAAKILATPVSPDKEIGRNDDNIEQSSESSWISNYYELYYFLNFSEL